MRIKVGTIVRHKVNHEIYVVVDKCVIIDKDNTWRYGVLYSPIDGTNLLVRAEKDFKETFREIK